jgi:dihydropteroate synthase
VEQTTNNEQQPAPKPRGTTLNCQGRLLDLSRPVVMGILNVTPDSFFDGGRYSGKDAALKQAEKMLAEGAAILDVGGASSRPGAAEVSEKEEIERVIPVIEVIKSHFSEAVISVDTWRAGVAKAAVEAGASLVNDISGGQFDEKMFETVAALGTPYILMHIQGTPATMQQKPHYEDVVLEVLDFFIQKTEKLRALGVKDSVLDPGFGFGKTLEHNYQLLKNLHVFGSVTGLSVLAGISRKSMICKVLKVNPEHALNGTTALHMVALQQGAKILRAHDAKEAMEVIKLWEQLQ